MQALCRSTTVQPQLPVEFCAALPSRCPAAALALSQTFAKFAMECLPLTILDALTSQTEESHTTPDLKYLILHVRDLPGTAAAIV